MMQLLDIPSILAQNEATIRLVNVFQDIAQNLEIQSNFCLRHPDYKPLEFPPELLERFQKFPEEMQQKYLSLQLRSFLYGIYYNGSMKTVLTADNDSQYQLLNLENNTVLGVDIGFYEQLHQNNRGKGYFAPGWSILKEESDGSLVVTQGGLKLHIERGKHLTESQKNATVGDIVAIKMPKNLVQNGFYMAVGDRGTQRLNEEKQQALTVRIYFNLTPEGAVEVMKSLTERLNKKEISFSFKVLYNPKDYERHDAGVLYFNKQDYEAVKQILAPIYQERNSQFKPEVPLFTLQLSPGLGLAEEPDQKFANQESFGMNRCQIVANGLLSAWHQGDNSPAARIEAILEEFSRLGIDWKLPYLNPNSEDIYSQEK